MCKDKKNYINFAQAAKQLPFQYNILKVDEIMIINSKLYNIPPTLSTADLSETTRLIVVSPELTSAEDELLQKMLSATGLNSNEFMHIIANKSNIAVNYFVNHPKSLKLISFGLSSTKLGLQVEVKKYRPFSLQKLDIVIVDDLTTIGPEVNLKKYIWNVLKAWFVNEK